MVCRQLVRRLAEAEHQARLGEHAGPVALGMRKHVERLPVARARVAHRVREPLDRLDVLREHLDAGIDDRLDVARARPGSPGVSASTAVFGIRRP